MNDLLLFFEEFSILYYNSYLFPIHAKTWLYSSRTVIHCQRWDENILAIFGETCVHGRTMIDWKRHILETIFFKDKRYKCVLNQRSAKWRKCIQPTSKYLIFDDQPIRTMKLKIWRNFIRTSVKQTNADLME